MRLPRLPRRRRVRYKPLVDIPFIGREAMLGHLQQHVSAVKSGQSRFIALEGTAGSGKSSLLSEFVFVNSRSPDVLIARVDSAVGLLDAEFYVHVFEALKAQSERVVSKLYGDTKRFRKFISEAWDEQEFGEFLASADWSQSASSPPPSFAPRGRSQDPMRQLLEVVSQHPWAIASATALAFLSRPCPSDENFQQWTAYWSLLLQGLAESPLPSGRSLVLLIDHLEPLHNDPQARTRWQSNWHSFVDATLASGFPILVIWSGTPEALLPLQQALGDSETSHLYQLGQLDDDEQQDLLHGIRRALPRTLQSRWETEVLSTLGETRAPGVMTLAAIWTAASQNDPVASAQPWPTTDQEVAEQLALNLVGLLRRQHAEQGELLIHLLGVFSFLPAGRVFSIDDVVPFIDFDHLGLEPVSGYPIVERLMGVCVRYGLLRYDAFTSQFTTVSSQIQSALRRAVVEEETTRQTMFWRRRVAVSVIDCLRLQQEGLLPALAAEISALGDRHATDLADYVTLPLCRMLRQTGKEEKYKIAQALGRFPSPLAIPPLSALLGDADEQLRSRVTQSLADLDSLDAYSTLLKAARDFNSDVRWIAAMALGKRKHSPVVEVLIELLSDEDKEVGRIAALGLGTQGDIRAVTHLIDATQDRYPLLRESAAQALGQLADLRAVPALQQLSGDNNRQVRKRAEAALASFGSLNS